MVPSDPYFARMSALSQKRTCAPQKVMSALPPKADMCVALAYVCFGPKADIASFDHLVGATYERVGNGDTERLGGPEVCDQFDFCGLLDWQISRLFALEDAAGIDANCAMLLRHTGAIANQRAGLCKFGETKGRRLLDDLTTQCPLWVKSGHGALRLRCPLYPQ
jgi:hypothetical protein